MIAFGFRNALRSTPRLALVAALIGAPFFLLLTLQAIGRAVDVYADRLLQGVNDTLQLRAAGSMGHVNMVAQSDILPQRVLERVRQLPHVAKVEPYVLAMTPTEGHNFAMIVGLEPGDARRLESHGEAGSPRIIAGRDLVDSDRGKRVAVIGQGVARWARIDPRDLAGAELTLDLRRTHPVIFALERPPARLSVVGVYASGYVFGDMQLFVPLDTFREIYGVAQGVSWLFVKADSAASVPLLAGRLRAEFGSEADVIAPVSAAEFQTTTARTVRRLTAAGMAASALLLVVVVYFLMLLLVRQRAREIGTLKAIGAPERSIIGAFLAEALAYALAGGALGSLLSLALGAPAAQKLFGPAMGPFVPAQYKDTLLQVLAISSGIDAERIAVAAASVALAALAGSAYAMLRIIRLTPLEAMKHE